MAISTDYFCCSFRCFNWQALRPGKPRGKFVRHTPTFYSWQKFDSGFSEGDLERQLRVFRVIHKTETFVFFLQPVSINFTVLSNASGSRGNTEVRFR